MGTTHRWHVNPFDATRLETHLDNLLGIDPAPGCQAVVRDYCIGELMEYARITTGEQGNVYGTSRVCSAKECVCLCAHMDVDPHGIGYDDKVGIAIILELAQRLEAPFKLLLTVNEEQGQQGAATAAPEWFSDVGLIVALDRSGGNDFVSHVRGRTRAANEVRTCSIPTATRALTLLRQRGLAYHNCEGRTSDIVPLSRYAPAVNLSVGYYQEHTPNEWYSPAEARLALVAAQCLVEEWAGE